MSCECIADGNDLCQLGQTMLKCLMGFWYSREYVLGAVCRKMSEHKTQTTQRRIRDVLVL